MGPETPSPRSPRRKEPVGRPGVPRCPPSLRPPSLRLTSPPGSQELPRQAPALRQQMTPVRSPLQYRGAGEGAGTSSGSARTAGSSRPKRRVRDAPSHAPSSTTALRGPNLPRCPPALELWLTCRDMVAAAPQYPAPGAGFRTPRGPLLFKARRCPPTTPIGRPLRLRVDGTGRGGCGRPGRLTRGGLKEGILNEFLSAPGSLSILSQKVVRRKSRVVSPGR